MIVNFNNFNYATYDEGDSCNYYFLVSVRYD